VLTGERARSQNIKNNKTKITTPIKPNEDKKENRKKGRGKSKIRRGNPRNPKEWKGKKTKLDPRKKRIKEEAKR